MKVGKTGQRVQTCLKQKQILSYVVEERMIPFQVVRVTELRNLILRCTWGVGGAEL